ncbi:putative RNA-directed DNA polymerase [Tanacetum coccineum]
MLTLDVSVSVQFVFSCEGVPTVGANPDQAQRKLYIGGLSPEITNESLLTFFGTYGEIEEEAAKKAIDTPQKMFGGRNITVKLADNQKNKGMQTQQVPGGIVPVQIARYAHPGKTHPSVGYTYAAQPVASYPGAIAYPNHPPLAPVLTPPYPVQPHITYPQYTTKKENYGPSQPPSTGLGAYAIIDMSWEESQLNPPPLYRISPTNIFWDLTMAASSSFHDSLFSMNTLLHMITIKLSSTNYLLWRNHMIPIFTYQKLIGHINGTSISPSPKVTIEGKANPNPDLLTWTEDDQRAVILLQSSLTEEAAAEVLGLTTAHQIWLSLEAAYSNASVERIHLLRDSLRQLKKGTSSVSDYCRRFKALCNQLSAIGHPVVEIDKLHWFLCGLGPSYETFSTAIRATKPAPMFRDLVTQAESHELFLQSLHGTPTPPAVFHVETTNTDSAQGGGRSNRGNHSRGRGRGHNRRPPHCQLCLTNGHYATTCPSLYTYATQASPSSDESLAKAFHAQCHVNTNTPNWHVDSGATDHMTPACDSLHHSSPYPGNAKVMFGNGKTLPITHTGSTTVSHDIPLRNVLVIPKLNKKLLSVSKLTTDHPVDVLFSQPFFYIHDRKTKRVLARGRCEHGLYVLKDEPTAFIATAKVIKPASYELWHARLGHVSFDVISTLNKLGVLSITSLLPKPILCTPCQLAKGQRLPFTINAKRSSHPLDLIHCDLWGPAPICSKDGYRYYVAFIDDYSRVADTFDYLYKPCPEQPADTATEAKKAAFRAEFKKHSDVACIMLGKMSPALQRQQAPGKPVSEHVLEMKGLMDQLHTLGKPYDNDMAVNLINRSLNKDFGDFVRNFNMHCVGKIDTELHTLLVDFEKGLKDKAPTPQVFTIQNGRDNKPKPQANKKFKGKGKLIRKEVVPYQQS